MDRTLFLMGYWSDKKYLKIISLFKVVCKMKTTEHCTNCHNIFCLRFITRQCLRYFDLYFHSVNCI